MKPKPNLLDFYVLKNPMTVEIERFRKRFFNLRKANPVNTAMLSIVMIIYGSVVMIVIANRESMQAMPLVILTYFLLMFLAPATLYTSIAGERERRSWDMLMVAPVTRGQVIAGKFLAACAAEIIAMGFFLVPIVIAGVYAKETQWSCVIAAIIFVLANVFLANALTILFSARSKRPLIALGVTFGFLFVFLIVFPIFIGYIFGPFANLFNEWHPLSILSTLATDPRAISYVSDGVTRNTGVSIVILPIVFCIAFTIILLIWAERTLAFADNNVGFLPKKKEKE